MKLSEAFPSRYLKATDLPEDGSQTVTIEKIAVEQVGHDKQTKPVIYFEEFGAGLVLNKTNGRTIARLFGSEEFDDWIGQKIALYVTEVDFQGDMVQSIRVRSKPGRPAAPIAKPRSVPLTQANAVPASTRNDGVEVDEDGIPF